MTESNGGGQQFDRPQASFTNVNGEWRVRWEGQIPDMTQMYKVPVTRSNGKVQNNMVQFYEYNERFGFTLGVLLNDDGTPKQSKVKAKPAQAAAPATLTPVGPVVAAPPAASPGAPAAQAMAPQALPAAAAPVPEMAAIAAAPAAPVAQAIQPTYNPVPGAAI